MKRQYGPAIYARRNQLSCANRVRCNWTHTRKRKKGCFTAFLDASPTVLAALTEPGEGTEPSVEVVRGCEEVLCSLFCPKHLHIIPSKDSRVVSLQITETRSRRGQTLKYSQGLVRTHPSRTDPGLIFRHRYSESVIVILYIKSNYDWLCVLTLIISGTIAQFGADKIVSFAITSILAKSDVVAFRGSTSAPAFV